MQAFIQEPNSVHDRRSGQTGGSAGALGGALGVAPVSEVSHDPLALPLWGHWYGIRLECGPILKLHPHTDAAPLPPHSIHFLTITPTLALSLFLLFYPFPLLFPPPLFLSPSLSAGS